MKRLCSGKTQLLETSYLDQFGSSLAEKSVIVQNRARCDLWAIPSFQSACLVTRTPTLPSSLNRQSAMTRWPTTWRLWVMKAQSFPLRSATSCLWPTRTQWDRAVLHGASFPVSSRRKNPKAMKPKRVMPRTTGWRLKTSCRRFATPSWSSWIRASFQRPRKRSRRRDLLVAFLVLFVHCQLHVQGFEI